MQIQVNCSSCGKPILKEVGEVNRATDLGRRLFCGLSCSAKASNVSRRAKEIVCTCPCGKRFKSTTRKKASKHCSASCASKYSMSDERREAQRAGGMMKVGNLLSVDQTLKRREAWKYSALREVLRGRPHEFEYKIGRYVFDLALLDEKILVEFDGPYHGGARQKKVDAAKEKTAAKKGFTLIRRPVLPATVVGPETIAGL